MSKEVKRALPLYEQIYQSIKDLIFKGEYKPGEKIYEVQIAKDFNVSRSPVREAVHALKKEGLIIIDEKSQIRIYEPSASDVEDIYQCRSALESLAVKLTTQRASDRQLQKIEDFLTETEKELQKKNFQRAVELNAVFHETIMKLCQNKRLEKNLTDLWSLLNFYRVMNSEGEERLRTVFADHSEIFTSMKQRKAEEASNRMTDHIMKDLDHIFSVLKKNKNV